MLEKLKKIIGETLGADEKEVVPSADLATDLNATNIEIADLLARLEEEFLVKIPPSAGRKLQTVGDIENYLLDHLAEFDK